MDEVSDRAEIFARIKRALHVPENDALRRQIVADRLAHAPRGIIPESGRKEGEERLSLFVSKLKGVEAQVERLETKEEIPAALLNYLQRSNLPLVLRLGDDPFFQAIDWSTAPELTLARGPSDGQDPVGLSHAFAGIAETGTLVLLSGRDNPTTLNFLPPVHCVVIEASTILGAMEDIWEHLGERSGKGVLPRTVNFITGPSRSGDIEQTLLLGAHGPHSLFVLVVG